MLCSEAKGSGGSHGLCVPGGSILEDCRPQAPVLEGGGLREGTPHPTTSW